MNARAALSFLSLAASLLAACGSDDKSGGAPRSDGGHTGTPGTVPSYINVDVCAHIVESMSLSFSAECGSCCKNAGYADSSAINDGKCTCGNMPDSGGGTVCASQIASSDVCSACCNNAGYSINVWIGGMSCECNGKANDTVCAGATSGSSACTHCCLSNGFLGYGFVGIGAPSCSCHGK